MSTAARLNALSSQTLSQVLERRRLQDIGKTPPASQLTAIKRNLEVLREGILGLEEQEEDDGDVSGALRGQWERMRRMMLGDDGRDIAELPPRPTRAPMMSDQVDLKPYTDDVPTPPSPAFEPEGEIEVQRQMMDEQDTHLDSLSSSIRRQRELSEHIGSELDVHTGLLEDLEVGIDRTAGALGGARRRLDRVGRGARDNGSAVTIGVLIVVLLILIVVFKT